MNTVNNWSWPWPQKGQNEELVVKEVLGRISSPYEQTPPPLCYPGTPLSWLKNDGLVNYNLRSLAEQLVSKQLNMIGCHTHGKLVDGNLEFHRGEGGFESIHQIEREVIWMLASVLGGSPNTVDGFFLTGGTSGNLQALFVAREWLRKQIPQTDHSCIKEITADKPNNGVILLTTPASHYSVFKAAEILDIADMQTVKCEKCGYRHMPQYKKGFGGNIALVGMNSHGEMSVDSLKAEYSKWSVMNNRRFIVVATLGTTATGAVDPIPEISEFVTWVNKHTSNRMYLHIDAAFGGMTVPFVNPTYHAAFQNEGVASIVVDGHKMGQLPYTSGIFICRKNMSWDKPNGENGLLESVGRSVEYINGHLDDTLEGSRTAINPILAWAYYRTIGREGQTRYAQECLWHRDELVKLILEKFPGVCDGGNFSPVSILPYSPYVNILPLAINSNWFIPSKMPDYELRSDVLPSNPADPASCPDRKVYKLCVMPHTFKHLQGFVDQLHKLLG